MPKRRAIWDTVLCTHAKKETSVATPSSLPPSPTTPLPVHQSHYSIGCPINSFCKLPFGLFRSRASGHAVPT
eukprot:4228186-Amphidinium_carterae.1